jgi:hypothetical protein
MTFRKNQMRAAWLGAMAIAVGISIRAQTPPPAGPTGPPADAPPPRAVAAGPYAVTVASDPSLPTHTIYRPTDLNAVKGKLPIVAWGNGGCINSNRGYVQFLSKIASHGFLVVAIGPESMPEPDLSNIKPGQPLPPLTPEMRSRTAQLGDGIDWAIAQNGQKGGAYAGKLNTKAIAVMGTSCGGIQAILTSKDPRVTTSVIWNSGVFNTPNRMVEGTKDDLKGFHAPVAYVIGGPSDIAYANSEDDFQKIEGVPLFNANLNVGHGGTFRQPNGGRFGEFAVAWLQWQLKGDKAAAKMFVGPKCGLCTDPVWTVKKKNLK